MQWLRRRDRIRRCTACGEEWTVSRKLTKPFRPVRRRLGVRQVSETMVGGWVVPLGVDVDRELSDASARSEEADRVRALLAQLRQCPKCGSTEFEEH